MNQSIFSRGALTALLVFFLLMNFPLSSLQAQAQSRPEPATCPAGSVCKYVSTTGNDNNNGNSEASAYRTIQKAIDEIDPRNNPYTAHIRVLGGTYNETIEFKHSWSGLHRLNLSSYKGVAVLNGQNYYAATNPNNLDADPDNDNTGPPVILIKDKCNIRLYNLQIQNHRGVDAVAVKVEGASSGVTITSCTITNIGWTDWNNGNPLAPSQAGSEDQNANAILVIGNDRNKVNEYLQITDNLINNCATGWSEALTVTGNVENFAITRNTIHDIKNIGIDIAGHYPWVKEGFSSSTTSDDLTDSQNQARLGWIEDNVVYNCVSPITPSASAGIYIDGARDIVITRNKSYDNGAGFSIGCEQCKTSSQVASGNVLRENWAYGNNGPALILGSGIYGIYDANGNPVLNNDGTERKGYNTPINNNGVFNNTFCRNWKRDSAGDLYEGVEISILNNRNSHIKQNIIAPREDKINSEVIGMGHWNNAIPFHRDNENNGFNVNENLAVAYNLFWQSDLTNLNDFVVNINFDSPNTNLRSDPLITLQDYRINAISPAYNAGDPNYTSRPEYKFNVNTSKDFLRTQRVKGGRVDIGAHETKDGLQGTEEYIFESKAFSGQALDVWANSTANGARVSLYQINLNNNQRFMLERPANSNSIYVCIKNKNSNKVFDCSNNKQVIQMDKNDSSHGQQFKLSHGSSTHLILESRQYPGEFLTVSQGSGNVTIAPRSTSTPDKQLFRMTRVQ